MRRSVRAAARRSRVRGRSSAGREGRRERRRIPGGGGCPAWVWNGGAAAEARQEPVHSLGSGGCATGARELWRPDCRCRRQCHRCGGHDRLWAGARSSSTRFGTTALESVMKLRVYLDLSNAVTRRRMAALLRADGEVALVGTAEDADVVVSERVVATAAPGAVAPGGALTARELEVLRLVARGLSNKEIAADLRITTHTVKYHLAAVLEKLGVRSRTEAVSLGVRTGLVPL